MIFQNKARNKSTTTTSRDLLLFLVVVTLLWSSIPNHRKDKNIVLVEAAVTFVPKSAVQRSKYRLLAARLHLEKSSNSDDIGGDDKIVSANDLETLESILKLRGGQDSDDEDEEEDDEDDESSSVIEQVLDVTKSKVLPAVITASTKTAKVLKKVAISAYRAFRRAVEAGLEGDDEQTSEEEDGDEEVTVADEAVRIATKFAKTLQRMIKAAFTFPENEDATNGDEESDAEEDEEGEVEVDSLVVETAMKAKIKPSATDEDDDIEEIAVASKIERANVKSPSTDAGTAAADFGSFLSQAYNVDDMRGADGLAILGGTFQDALQTARSQARMLIVFIPSERPSGAKRRLFGGGNKKQESSANDQQAIGSLLSADVAKAANKKSRKNNEELGSFAIWGARAGSSEATSVMKKLKLKPTSNKGEKRAILCVVYPAYVSGLDASNLPKIVPKLLAQHHCNPPPKPDSMVSWMNALRKRHGKQYQKMQTELAELQFYKERQEGYKESVKSDKDRKKKEAEEKAQEKARKEEEAKRQAEIEARRKELKESLPEDQKGGNAKKIALRFADGRSGQRGFSPDQPLSVLFNWVDAMYEVEREKVVLTTLNGQKTFTWDDEGLEETTLEDAEIGKMTAFRVTLKKEEEESSDDEDADMSQ